MLGKKKTYFCPVIINVTLESLILEKYIYFSRPRVSMVAIHFILKGSISNAVYTS